MEVERTWRGTTLQQRFDAKWIPEPNTGCWLWMACLAPTGYGKFGMRPAEQQAHRVAWRLYRGPIPEGMVIDHVCRNRGCVNPDHLRVVTQRINALENSTSCSAIHAAQTHCRRGHPLSGANLSVEFDDRGRQGRRCNACRNAKQRRLYAANLEAEHRRSAAKYIRFKSDPERVARANAARRAREAAKKTFNKEKAK